MSFLQPFLLAALPLIALPIVIHLINQRRYQTVRWAAMMFLLAANKMSRGYARLRQYLIMAARMLAIAGLIFAISRPLTGGWLGRAGGSRPETTILLMDRSPSMQESGRGTGESKLETGRKQLAATLKTLGSARWVLIESNTNKPRELESIDALLNSPGAEPASAASDIPGMLMAAHDYIKANKSGRTEIWICSDIRENDWNADGGRWQTLRDAFLEFPQGVRLHLLAYPKPAPGNRSVRVTEVRRQKTGDGAELLVSLSVGREAGGETKESVPVQFEIDGARSEVAVELNGPRADLKDYRIPLGKARERGWGRVSIPADANLADNDYWFTFSPPSPRHALIVAEDPQAAPALQLAASIAPDPALQCSADVIAPDGLATVEWEKVALLMWQAPLPEGESAKAVRAFMDRGGQAIFFPPKTPTKAEFLRASWTEWVHGTAEAAVESWRGDQDLLANTQSGTALPVGQLQVRNACGLSGEFTPLAVLKGNAPLLARVATTTGGAYFCATTPSPGDSSLATNGVVFYVLVQRALAAGAAVLGSTRQLVAGETSGENPARWKRLAGMEQAVSSDYPIHGGVYQSGERLLAVNRPAAEDGAPALADRRVAGLFKGLDFSRVDDSAGSSGSLIQEVWRLFLAAMMVAMMAEAGLCMPKPARPSRTAS
ncbi:MAG: N-terminal double-transrane protein [Planctomycetota bacterium]|nr:N-terminal double-transrane protein [Planctomycetota bacterium]